MKCSSIFFYVITIFSFAISCKEKKTRDVVIENNNVPQLALDSVDTHLMGELAQMPDAPSTNRNDIVYSKGNDRKRDKNFQFTSIRLILNKLGYFIVENPDNSEKSSIDNYTSNEKKILLIQSLLDTANFLSDRQHFIYNKEGVNKPKQIGLAYSWGSKTYQRRNKTADGCGQEIYGLDCSGFIYQVLMKNGVMINPNNLDPSTFANADHLRSTLVLQKGLKNYFGSSAFEVKDLGHIQLSKIESGDIIYFKDSSLTRIVHIAIALRNINGAIEIFESSGLPNRCAMNLEKSFGVRHKFLVERLLQKPRYYIVRITTSD